MWPGRNLKHPGKMAEEGWPLHLALRETRQAGRLQASCSHNFRGRLRVGGKKLTHYRNKSKNLKVQTSSSQIFSLRRSDLLNCVQCLPETKHGCTRTEVSRQLANLPSLMGQECQNKPYSIRCIKCFQIVGQGFSSTPALSLLVRTAPYLVFCLFLFFLLKTNIEQWVTK